MKILHAAVAEPDMGDLHDHCGPAQQDNFVARRTGRLRPVQSSVGRKLLGLIARVPCSTAERNDARHNNAVVTATAQLLEDPDQRQLFRERTGRVRPRQLVELNCPATSLQSRLHRPFVLERGLS